MNGYWMACGALMVALSVSGWSWAQTRDRDSARESIPLWPKTPPHDSKDGFVPSLTPYLLDGDETRGAVIVAPGGGYAGRASHEGGPVAEYFNRAGYHAFVLNYRVHPNRHPAPLSDAARSVRLVRSRAEEWHVKPDKVAVLGFSAGGHLTGSLGVLFDQGDAGSEDPVARISSRPDAIVLCYAVISAESFGHRGSFDNLLGPDATEVQRQSMSLEKLVKAETPPTFLWSTADDTAVPVENSFVFARALREKGIPFELHVFPHGPHGLGLASDDPRVSQWSALCADWLRSMGW